MWSRTRLVLVVCLLVVVAIWFAVNHPELIPIGVAAPHRLRGRMPRMDSEKATSEPDPRLIQTGYGQYSEGPRMSTRLRVFAWIVVAVAVAVWIAAVWFVMFHTGPMPLFQL
jgi:hypothetical protein